MIKSAIFDFDGTLIDSNEIKSNTFVQYSDFDAGGKDVMERLIKNKSYDRYDLWKIYCKELGLSDQERLARVTSFDLALRKAVSEAKEKAGATAILRNFCAKGIRLYISSMTPKSELEFQLSLRDWLKYFEDIFGSPNNKSHTVKSIIEKNNLSSNEVIVIGDGEDDWRSATENKVNFYPVGNLRSIQVTNSPYNLEQIDKLILS